jgi:hypothetical protein
MEIPVSMGVGADHVTTTGSGHLSEPNSQLFNFIFNYEKRKQNSLVSDGCFDLGRLLGPFGIGSSILFWRGKVA